MRTTLLADDQVVPLYHPTSILLVDDNEAFLNSMKLVLQSGFDCFAFHRVQDALEFIHSEPGLLSDVGPPPASMLESAMEHIRDPAERRLHIEVSRLPQVFSHRSRFVRSSVLIADNAMPDMSGLEMLDLLRAIPMRKMLLSGMVDEQVAAQALNTGLIDAFYPKHHPQLHDALAAHLRKLQLEYFRQLTQPYEPALACSDARFLRDRAFAERFARFVDDNGIIEHCVLMQPPGVLGVDEQGNASILLVADEDYRQASFEIAEAEGAPPALLRQLMASQTVATFPTENGFYTREFSDNWSNFVWTGSGSTDHGWHFATVTEPEVVSRFCGEIASYADYRRRRLN